jgi:hypothetical protein
MNLAISQASPTPPTRESRLAMITGKAADRKVLVKASLPIKIAKKRKK